MSEMTTSTPGHLLNLLQDVEAAPAAIALHRVGGIGDELQFLQHELRNDQRAVDESGFADVRDAAVDDHAGVENLVVALRRGRAEQADEPRGLEPFAVLAAEHEAQVRQHDQHEAVKELDAAIRAVGPEQSGADGVRHGEADGAADQRAEDPRERGFAEPALEERRRAPPGRGRRPTLAARPTGSGWRNAAAYATAATNRTRASANQDMRAPFVDIRL